MGFVLCETYWSNDDGTASPISHGTIGSTRYQWPNGVSNHITGLYTVNRGSRTPRGSFVCELYQNNIWTPWSSGPVRSYYNWVAMGFNIQGIYNRWFKLSFAGATKYFRIGQITDLQFIPPELQETYPPGEDEEEDDTEALEAVGELRHDFENESLRVDIEFESIRESLVEGFENSTRESIEYVDTVTASLYDRITNAWTGGLSGLTNRVSGAINNIRGLYEDIGDIYNEINNLSTSINELKDGIKIMAIDAVIGQIWAIIGRVLVSELDEEEE